MKKLIFQLAKLIIPLVPFSFINPATAQIGPSMFNTDELEVYQHHHNPGPYNILVPSNDTVATHVESGSELNSQLLSMLAPNHILFGYRDYQLDLQAMKQLDQVALLMVKHPTAIFEINGYTDARGDYEDNLILAEKRAASTKNYLIAKGVDPSQLIHYAFGEQHLKNICDSDSHCGEIVHASNRRVEIKLVSIK